MFARLNILFCFFYIFLACGCGGSSAPVQPESVQRIDLLCSQGAQAHANYEFKQAEDLYRQALGQAIRIDNMGRVVNCRLHLAELGVSQKKISLIADNLEAADLIINMDNLIYYRSRLLLLKGKLAEIRNEHDSAVSLYIKSINIANEKSERARAQNALGRLLINLNRHEEAMDYLARARSINLDLKLYQALANNEYNIGNSLYIRKKYKEALPYFKSALGYDRLSENSRGIYQDIERIAAICDFMNNKQMSLYYYTRLINLAVEIYPSEVPALRVKLNALLKQVN